MKENDEHILNALYQVLLTRKGIEGSESYVASLYEKGSIKIGEKILEESQEFIDEALALDENIENKAVQKNIREEAADLLFHMMIMLAHHNVSPSDVFEVLEKRFGTSGHIEKANRCK